MEERIVVDHVPTEFEKRLIDKGIPPSIAVAYYNLTKDIPIYKNMNIESLISANIYRYFRMETNTSIHTKEDFYNDYVNSADARKLMDDIVQTQARAYIEKIKLKPKAENTVITSMKTQIIRYIILLYVTSENVIVDVDAPNLV